MKIVILGPGFPYRGSIASSNERMAEELTLMGHEVFFFNFKLQYPNFLFPGKSQYLDAPPESKAKSYRYINSINPFNWIKVAFLLSKVRPDFVIFRYWMSFMAPCFATISFCSKFIGNIKSIAWIDNVMPHERKFFDLWFGKLFFYSMDQFVVMNTESKAILAQYSPKPILASFLPIVDNLGNKTDQLTAKKQLGIESSDRVLLFFGLIRKYKGLDLLIQAMSHPKVRDLDIKLIIAGEFYTDAEEYMNLVTSLQLEPNIIWYSHYIADSDLSCFFGATDAVVLPYRHGTQSGVTQVAYHFETPIIATRVGGLSEFVEDNIVGYLADPTAESIAETIIKLYEKNELNILKEHLALAKKNYEWKTFATQFVDFATY